MAYKTQVEGGSCLAQKSCNTIATVWAYRWGGGGEKKGERGYHKKDRGKKKI